jgi:hypothetical protein
MAISTVAKSSLSASIANLLPLLLLIVNDPTISAMPMSLAARMASYRTNENKPDMAAMRLRKWTSTDAVRDQLSVGGGGSDDLWRKGLNSVLGLGIDVPPPEHQVSSYDNPYAVHNQPGHLSAPYWQYSNEYNDEDVPLPLKVRKAARPPSYFYKGPPSVASAATVADKNTQLLQQTDVSVHRSSTTARRPPSFIYRKPTNAMLRQVPDAGDARKLTVARRFLNPASDDTEVNRKWMTFKRWKPSSVLRPKPTLRRPRPIYRSIRNRPVHVDKVQIVDKVDEEGDGGKQPDSRDSEVNDSKNKKLLATVEDEQHRLRDLELELESLKSRAELKTRRLS